VLCREDNIGGFWGCASFFPRLPQATRRVVTVYDLNYRLVPDTMHTAAVWQYRLFFRRDLARADSVLAISRGTAERVTDYFGRGVDGIVYPAVSTIFGRRPDLDVGECLQRYKLTFPYVLAVATWEPRKNLEVLLTTLDQMQACGELGQRRVVLIGGRGWKDGRLTAMVGDRSNLVHPLGYVPDHDLPLLYSGADAFVFPSTYEGFGMPVLEARACGTPVVTTDTPELREAGGPDAIYVRPTMEGIRSGLRQVLSSGQRPSGVFERPTWADGARTLAAALRGTL
jgi:glycosyltransferase involved in cell wall biosynthesis